MIRFTPAGAQVLPRSGDDGHSSAVELLAETMREMAFAGENVCLETLLQRCHLTADEIRAFGPEAVALAKSRAIRLLSPQRPRLRVPAGSRHVAA